MIIRDSALTTEGELLDRLASIRRQISQLDELSSRAMLKPGHYKPAAARERAREALRIRQNAISVRLAAFTAQRAREMRARLPEGQQQALEAELRAIRQKVFDMSDEEYSAAEKRMTEIKTLLGHYAN